MFYLSSQHPNNYWGVTDTRDCVEEIYSFEQLKEYRNSGIKIKGLFNTEVWAISFLRPRKQMPDYKKKFEKARLELEDLLKRCKNYYDLIDFIDENKDKETDEYQIYYGNYLGFELDTHSNHISWFIKEG